MTRVVAIIFCSCHRPCKERCHHNCQLPLCFLSFFCCLIFAPKPAAVIPVPKRFFYNTVCQGKSKDQQHSSGSRVHFIKLIRQSKNVFNPMLIQNIVKQKINTKFLIVKSNSKFGAKLRQLLGKDWL